MPDRFKQALRQTCLQIRKNLSPSYQKTASHEVCARIRQLEQYRAAKRIALYLATNGEINLERLWRSAPLHRKHCYFPVLKDDNVLSFLPATPTSTFYKNRFGIDEPCVSQSYAISPEKLDVMFLPLLAFDRKGTRLGMGGGYYDRTLAITKPAFLVGIAYEFQLQTFIEAAEWDIPLNVVITEHNMYWKS
jgi:5-formyltetrahydrofolate cyclo-ligase